MASRRRDNPHPYPCGRFSRRSFLKTGSILAGGAVLGGCRPPLPALPPGPPPTQRPGTLARVGIVRASSYDPALVRRQTEALFDSLGGLQDVIRPGDRVAVKVNLTGGIRGGSPPFGTTAPESYVTHPAVARAVCELLRDAGAKEICIVECVSEWESYDTWGFTSVAEDLGATLIDLNRPDPHGDFASAPAGPGWFIYDHFRFHHILEEVDALVSVAKMKCHYLLGVTQSMKNLVGLAPYMFYQLNPGDGYRTGFHGREGETALRLPRVVMDLNRARPVNLSLIDGIQTVDGSEGPWNQDLRAQKPGLLIGGKNPVAADSVAVAAMGFDPAAEYPNPPFLRAENHLNLAHTLGMGTNRLDEIDIVGANLNDVKRNFRPAW